LKNRDKIKDYAIAQLSDQIMALTARMQEIEILIPTVSKNSLQ
jgi:hypothetical protein